VATLRINLDRRRISRLTIGLTLVNLVFTAGTALFIHYWAQRDLYGPRGRAAIDYVLVQFHLATENVVAAWYSSMLLLTVAAAAMLAFALDRRQPATRADRLLSAGWLLVAAAFAGLSLDEMGSLHERLGMIRHGASAATGWVYVLMVPIALVGIFMLAFAWFRLRRAPLAAVLFAVGTALFLSDPIFEQAEMTLLHAGGAQLAVHNALLVIEEGIVELGGALCFLLGVLIYLRRTAGDGPHDFTWSTPAPIAGLGAAGLLLTAGPPSANWLVSRLPPGDTGIPDNWFPAVALYFVALVLVATRGRRAIPLASVAMAGSAFFGASIYGYVAWLQRLGYPGTALDAAVTAVASACLLRLAASP
jgi:hypothetical protein